MRSWMTYSVELCVGEFILAIVFNVRDGWIDMLITWQSVFIPYFRNIIISVHLTLILGIPLVTNGKRKLGDVM